jgi:hypothetical protein
VERGAQLEVLYIVIPTCVGYILSVFLSVRETQFSHMRQILSSNHIVRDPRWVLTFYAPRTTHHASRFTPHASRFTLHAPRFTL